MHGCQYGTDSSRAYPMNAERQLISPTVNVRDSRIVDYDQFFSHTAPPRPTVAGVSAFIGLNSLSLRCLCPSNRDR